MTVLVGFLSPLGAHAATPWEELAFLPYGEGTATVGQTLPREDEQAYGPHGIAAGADGSVAVVDRIHRRVLVLGPDGALAETLDAPGRPGPAVLLPDGSVAVADQLDDRAVVFLGPGRQGLRSPRWALPPARLVTWTDPTGAVIVEGFDALQNRLPLGRSAVSPGALEQGLPAADGGVAVWAVRRDQMLVLGFDEDEVTVDTAVWPALADRPWRPGSVSVLAAAAEDAILAIETISADEGPLVVRRVVVRVGRDGALLDRLETPAAGPVVIPADLAALPGGAVWVLVSGEDGCRLLRGQLEGSP
jgi:hypothetical protein